MLCWPARTAATEGLSFGAFSNFAGNETRPLPPAVFRLQPCFSCHRVPQLALQALDFGTGLGVFQRDQCLSCMDNITVRDQNFPDNAPFEVLDRFSARLGFDGAISNRGALEGCEARPGTEAHDKSANQQVSCPGDTAKPVAERWRRRSQTPRNLPNLDVSECNFHEITSLSGREIVKIFAADRDASESNSHEISCPSRREIVKMFAADHGKIGCGEAPTLLPHSWFGCGGAGSREMT